MAEQIPAEKYSIASAFIDHVLVYKRGSFLKEIVHQQIDELDHISDHPALKATLAF